MQQHGSKYFTHRPPPHLTKGQHSTFAEHGHVAYLLNGIKNAATW